MNRMVFLALGLTIDARAGIGQEASHTAASPAGARTVVVRAQWLIDGIADKPRHSMEIVIRDNRIVDVRPANSQALPAAAQVIDPRSMLALRVNGADMSRDHGYPARTIIPAAPGVHNTKWVNKITFLEAG